MNIDDDHNNKNRTLNCADEYIYTLVVFTNRGKPKKQLEIDIVPKKWIFFDEEKKRLMVRYLKPKGKTYTEDQCTLIQDMVEKNIDVPESEETWPSVFFKPKGRASKLFFKKYLQSTMCIYSKLLMLLYKYFKFLSNIYF